MTLKKLLALLLALVMLAGFSFSSQICVFAEEDEEFEEVEGDEEYDENNPLKRDEEDGDDEEIYDNITDDEEPIVTEEDPDLLRAMENIMKGDYVAKTSSWAEAEVKKAALAGIIPGEIRMKDLTKKITRIEFAAVAVKAYEALTGQSVSLSAASPFKDTYNADVVKAYTLGVVTGTSATTFSPYDYLTREQAAVMLTRVYKKAKLGGWTINTDGDFNLQYSPVAPFADDANISDYAKQSVYFMVSNGILTGMGDNKFAPKNITNYEVSTGYANTTREQAIIITSRMIEKLK